MKVRSDFVTNSSSTSYLFERLQPFVVAKEMLECLVYSYMKYYELHHSDSSKERAEEFRMQLESLREFLICSKNFDSNILIPTTTNDETYIYKLTSDQIKKIVEDEETLFYDLDPNGDYIFVDTCTNHDWDAFLENLDEYVSFKQYNNTNEIHRSFADDLTFFDLEEKRFITRKEWRRLEVEKWRERIDSMKIKKEKGEKP